MISVIVPVYNVEPYLRKCLDSIVDQTCQDLEILVIDDGSEDHCGEICDAYAARDPKIRVFHTKNRGLSAARNLGLDHAKGEYVGFVDSDDWIEPDMYESLLAAAERTGADVAECGVFREYPNRTLERRRKDLVMSGTEAVWALLHGKLAEAVWNKLWNRRCFEQIRFPEGRIFEEYATTWRVFSGIDLVCTVSASKYHYLQREGSLSRRHDMRTLAGYWLAQRERYETLRDQADGASTRRLLRLCAVAVSRTWAYCRTCDAEERKAWGGVLREMHAFTRQYLPLLGDREWGPQLRFGVFFPHYYNTPSFWMAWLLNRAYLKIKRNTEFFV